MLDVGCGTGRLLLAAHPHFDKGDRYTGLDINSEFISICRDNYKAFDANFVYHAAHNPYYASDAKSGPVPWPFEDGEFNLLTALSVWTHLKEDDCKFYLKEVYRVLQPGGKALISFFVLDDFYKAALPHKSDSISPFYPQYKSKWIFDAPAYRSSGWFCPSWADVPEVAIGVSESAFLSAVKAAGLSISNFYVGSWKDRPGLFFQDLVELSRPHQ